MTWFSKYRTPLIWGGSAFVVLIVLLVALTGTNFYQGTGGIYEFDWAISNFFLSMRSESATEYALQFSYLIYEAPILLISCIMAGVSRTKHPFLFLIINALCIRGINIVFKNLLARPRPFLTVVGAGINLVEEQGYSCPSGHAMMAMGFFGAILWMIWVYRRDLKTRVVWCVLLGAAIVIIGLSRIYLGVHFTSDIIMGFCVSIVWLSIYTTIMGPLLLAPIPPNPKKHVSTDQNRYLFDHPKGRHAA